MKRRTTKNQNNASAIVHSRYRIVVPVGIVTSSTALYFLFAFHVSRTKTDAVKIVPKEELKGLKPEDAFAITVQRAYAVDVRFQQVYNAGWEAANGAIGEAFLLCRDRR